MTSRLRIVSALLLFSCAESRQAERPANAESDVPTYLTAAGQDAGREPSPIQEELAQLHQEALGRFNAAASTFSVADGIDRAEAEMLGEAYFSWQLGACGAVGDAREVGGEWHMPVRFGVAGRALRDPIRVNKATGVVSYAEGKSIAPERLITIERTRLEDNVRRSSRSPSPHAR